jgi:hypothetical protein
MAKIRLGAKPESFKHAVKFKMIDGSDGVIEVTFKYRTKTEFGKFIDEVISDAKTAATSTADEKVEEFSMARLMEQTAGSNADYILHVATGWNLLDVEDKPVEFTRAKVQELADQVPAAAAAIMETYRTACTEGRLGN